MEDRPRRRFRMALHRGHGHENLHFTNDFIGKFSLQPEGSTIIQSRQSGVRPKAYNYKESPGNIPIKYSQRWFGVAAAGGDVAEKVCGS